MKYYFLFLLLFLFNGLYGQDKTVPRPEYVIIINDEIVSKAKVDEYGKSGYVKSMSKGVSQEYRDSSVQCSSSVFQIKFSAKNPPLRKVQNR